MVRLALEKEGIEIVGAICRRKEKVGRDLGELIGIDRRLGITATNDPDAVFTKTEADILLHATTSFIEKAYTQTVKAMEVGMNVISVAEELAYPYARHPEFAQRIDKAAKKYGVTVLGTGMNPGFILDTMIIALTGACQSINKIRARRIHDESPYSVAMLKREGMGLTIDEFQRGLADSSVITHVGLIESISMISHSLGWEFDEVKETFNPIICETPRELPHFKIEAGRVAGSKNIAYGIKNGEAVITLEHHMEILPEETSDSIWIEGTPPVNITIKPALKSEVGTVAVAVNMIPQVINAEPGLVTMKDLPIPRALIGDVRNFVKV